MNELKFNSKDTRTFCLVIYYEQKLACWVLFYITHQTFTYSKSTTKAVEICEICSKLTIKTPERPQWFLSSIFMLTLNILHTFFNCFYCWLWTGKCFLWNSNSNQVTKFKKIARDWFLRTFCLPRHSDDIKKI